jgi:hypothetical protein
MAVGHKNLIAAKSEHPLLGNILPHTGKEITVSADTDPGKSHSLRKSGKLSHAVSQKQDLIRVTVEGKHPFCPIRPTVKIGKNQNFHTVSPSEFSALFA